MSITAFAYAVLALLLAPGPTNTLIGVAGAQGGMRRVLGILPFELAGYLVVILPLVAVGQSLLADWPIVSVAIKLAAAVWVMVLAIRLWGGGTAGEIGTVTPGRVFLTTMLNPKALVFALVLLPPLHDAAFVARLGLFCSMVLGVALVWGLAGSLTQARQDGGGRLLLVQRIASVWLGFVSIMLVAGVLVVAR